MLSNNRRETMYTFPVMVLIITVGISFLGLGFVMPLRALYGRQLGASSTEIGLMTTSFLLAGFLATPGIGWLADRIGYKNVLWMGLLMHAALMIAYIYVQDPVMLIGLRGLEGIASVSVLPPTRALMNTLAPRERQGEALGLLSAAQTAGILIGPAVGALLASQTGYTLSFVIASIPLVLAAIITLIFLPNREKQGGTSATLERRNAFAELFTRPLVLTYSLQIVLMIGNGVVMAIWSLYMLDRGASLPLIGLSYTTFALPIIFTAPFSGRLSDRYGRYWLFLSGMLLTGVIFCLYSLPSVTAWPIIFISIAEGIVTSVARSSLDGLLADIIPQDARGKVQANYTAAGLIGNLIGATAAGLLYGYSTGLPFLIAGLFCFGAGLLLLLPGISRTFFAARKNLQTELPNQELVEESMVEM
jgi:MFS transporter, DHA1 family, solute carrier family 18 (vesicular amine transporter), member 1/2